ncbi:acetolactate synthase 2 small subunit [Gallibacterium sp. AGMB14963]|uniref:acetolactate synthase 2 small subunit n=1 Tax=Gallibacterium faecale TaxID=3019086 RepID=UPI0022F1BAB5|nr:acetolactate synthase 2 small subunit [Gallibacterium sp. AGMB14963]MDA3978820.1 acetolactate synthase 2 small subunit [Gallibacterium sp. AGMB14963]
MKSYQISVQVEWRPETLERILRVVRHRGFVATTLTSQLENQQLSLTMSLCSERELSLLTNQLVKLYGVTNVTVLE